MTDTAELADVTVVIPAKNRASQIGAALDSVEWQTVRPREVIVVDDGSTDDTSAVATRPGVTIIRHEESKGAAEARNAAINAATSTYIAFLDSDDVWAPNHLERSLEGIKGHVLVTSAMIDTLGRGRGNVSGHIRPVTYEALLFPENIVCTSATMGRRDTILAAGGMRYFDRAEDLDLWIRMLALGSAVALPTPTVTYFVPTAYVDPGLEARNKRGTLEVLDRYAAEPWYTPRIAKLVSAQQAWDQIRHALKHRSLGVLPGHLATLVRALPYTPQALVGTFAHRRRARTFPTPRTMSAPAAADGAGRAAGRKVAYLVSQYPAFSHAFVTNEIAALREREWDIHPFSVTEPSTGAAPGERPAFVLQRSVAANLVKVLRFLAKDPAIVFRGLRAVGDVVARRDDRAPKSIAKQFAYLYEALVLLRELDARGLEHVHVHFANSAADVARLAKIVSNGRVTWSMTVHGPADFERAREADLRGKARAADALFCISEFARGEMARAVAAGDAERAVICRMGVSQATVDLAAGMAGRSSGPDVLRVLFVGRLVAKKDPLGLLRAVGDLARLPKNADRRVELTIVGDGPERAALDAALPHLPANVTVDLTGAASHDVVLDHYGRTDVFCLPSYSEGLPVVVMEALAAELAVVTTPVAALPELVKEGETGLLVAPGDTAALTAALQRLWASPELRASLGAAGRAAVEAEFVSATATLVLDDAFVGLLSGGVPARL